MKINKYILQRLIASSSITITVILSIFFLFSLLSNLGERYDFLIIIYLSLISSVQILIYIPLVIFFLIIVFFSISITSFNELKVIMHYISKKKILFNFSFFILIFIYFEINKTFFNEKLENFKTNIIENERYVNFKLFIDLINETDRNYLIFNNINSDSKSATKYTILDNSIEEVIYSDKLEIVNNNLISSSFYKLQNDQISEYINEKILFITNINLFNEKINKFEDTKVIFEITLYYKIIILLLVFTLLCLIIFDKKTINKNNKNIKSYIFGGIVILYTYFNFNFLLTSYEIEFNILSFILIISLFFKKSLDEKYI